MVDIIQVLWTPVGENMPNLGARALVDVTDGDTPTLRMPVRMLSVDTPEVTAKTEAGAGRVDDKFAELADWIRQDKAPITAGLAGHLLDRLGGGGTRQFAQGKAASAWFKARVEERLSRPNEQSRSLFIRTADAPFDDVHRLLAYLAPNYTANELKTLTLAQRATFNLDLVESGWAAPFVIFPSIPGERDYPLFVAKSEEAIVARRGIWDDPLTLVAYEYRMCEKLYSITKQMLAEPEFPAAKRYAWRSRYAADIRDRRVFGPEDYFDIPPQYRLWIWPQDVQRAISMLNLVPQVG